MINILFFGQIREVLHTEHLALCLSELVPSDLARHDAGEQPVNVGQLRLGLRSRSELWHETLCPNRSLVAVNQSMANEGDLLKTGDEVAFFPPVTGG